MSMPVSAGSAGWITPATSPSVMSRTAAPALRTPGARSAWRGRARIRAAIPAGSTPVGFGGSAVFVSGRLEIEDAFGIAGTDRDLFHVDVGRVEQRACFRHGHGGDCTRHVLGAQRGALERIDRDVDLGPVLVADRLPDEQHGRLVAL